MPRLEKYSNILECQMTQEEKDIAAHELVKVSSEYREKVAAKAETLKGLNDELKEIDTEMAVLTKAAFSGIESRTVDIKVEYNFKEKKAVHIRLDTGEIFKEVEIAEDELQEELV